MVLFSQATEKNITVGSQVWVEDPALAWVEAEVLEINGQEVKAQTISGNLVCSVTNL